MTEETTFVTKSDKPEDKTTEVKAVKTLSESSFFGISIKAWLAIFVIGTLCACEMFTCYSCLFILKQEYVMNNEMWMIAGMILAHYYKEKPVTPPSNTTTTTSSETTPTKPPTV